MLACSPLSSYTILYLLAWSPLSSYSILASMSTISSYIFHHERLSWYTYLNEHHSRATVCTLITKNWQRTQYGTDIHGTKTLFNFRNDIKVPLYTMYWIYAVYKLSWWQAWTHYCVKKYFEEKFWKKSRCSMNCKFFLNSDKLIFGALSARAVTLRPHGLSFLRNFI